MRIIYILLMAMMFLLSGCAELAYYGHATVGQIEVISAGEPIEEIIASADTNVETHRQLKLIIEARQFAITELKLPNSDSFRDYADLKRPWVLWNVFATPELSLKTKQWCYPFFGCHDYRAYFNEAYAKQVASELEQEGMDVHIAHSPAYSTQGWFSDPIYNPMLRYDDLTLIGILFHELAHERVYIIDDSELNESFATAVQHEGVRRWLDINNKESEYKNYLYEEKINNEFIHMMIKHRSALQRVYTSELVGEEKRSKKKMIFKDLREHYKKLKQNWGGYAGYDHWFKKPLNNARLAPIGTYNNAVPKFKRLLEIYNGDLNVFYHEVERLSLMSKSEREKFFDNFLNL